MIIIIVLVLSVLAVGSYIMYTAEQGRKREACQKTIEGFRNRGPLDELTAHDAECMDLLKSENSQ